MADNILKSQRMSFFIESQGNYFQHKMWALTKEKLHALIKVLFLKFMI